MEVNVNIVGNYNFKNYMVGFSALKDDNMASQISTQESKVSKRDINNAGYYMDYNINFKASNNSITKTLENISKQIEENPQIVEEIKARLDCKTEEVISIFLNGLKMIEKSPSSVLNLLKCRKSDNSYRYSIDEAQAILQKYKDKNDLLDYIVRMKFDSETAIKSYNSLNTYPEETKMLLEKRNPDESYWISDIRVIDFIVQNRNDSPETMDYLVNAADKKGFSRFLIDYNNFRELFDICKNDLTYYKGLLEQIKYIVDGEEIYTYGRNGGRLVEKVYNSHIGLQ